MTKRQNTRILETKKAYDVIMTSFLTKALEMLHKEFPYDRICSHRICSDKGEVKRGADSGLMTFQFHQRNKTTMNTIYSIDYIGKTTIIEVYQSLGSCMLTSEITSE